MPSFEQSSVLRWNGDDEPDLVLFVSHRWRTAVHPDPDGRTLRTIARVLAALDCLARGLDPTCDASVPTLRSPAMLHASVLLHRLMQRFDGDGASALDRVAIFYDFSCMVQASAPEHLERLKNGLASFPTMIPDRRVALLALRQPQDDYESRAWCVAESVLSLNYEADRPWVDTFPLRLDLEPRENVVAFEPLEVAIEAWSRDVCVQSRITSARFRDWLELVQLCVDWYGQSREEATARLHHSSGIAEHSFRLWVTTTIRFAEAGDSVVDIGPLLRGMMASSGLHCTDPDDVVPTALLILAGLRWEELNRNSGSPRVPPESGRDFWRQCLSRFLEGRPLRAEVQLRESRSDGALSPPTLSLVPD
jgi:hypothetical protein